MKSLTLSCLESRVEEDGVLYGRFCFGSFARGEAVTAANALRRGLLAEIFGYAITHVEFIGAKHEYSTLPGTQETVLDVLLNLKKLAFTSITSRHKNIIGYCSGRGPGVLTGRDLKLPPGVQCTNPDHVIAHLADDGELHFSCLISLGKNYVMQTGPPYKPQLNADRQTLASTHDGRHPARSIFSIDAVFMPVLRVNYAVQSDETSKAFALDVHNLQVTEHVIFEIWTNGNITPREAMHQASTYLIRLFSLFQIEPEPAMFFRPRLSKERIRNIKKIFEYGYNYRHTLQTMHPNHFLDMDIAALPLSPALYVALKEQQMSRLGDFLRLTYEDLLALKGMTPATVFEVLCLLRSYGIRFLPKVTMGIPDTL